MRGRRPSLSWRALPVARASRLGFLPLLFDFVQHAPRTALDVALADVGDLAGILILLREGGGVALRLSRLFTRHAFPPSAVFVLQLHPGALYTPRLSLRRPSLVEWTSDEGVGAYTRRAA
jgi:hypothetical protein